MKNSDVKAYYDGGIIDSNRYQSEYEKERWFQNDVLRNDHKMTMRTIKNAVSGLDFATCLEVGPGPGTWTKVLFDAHRDAQFTLIDISEAMRQQFLRNQKELVEKTDYLVTDFIDFQTEKKYDVFFSSRALEYFDDKKAFVEKVKSLLNENGTGIIITKSPNYAHSNGDERDFHKGQISADDFTVLLKEAGFTDVSVAPAIIRIPVLSRLTGWFSNIFHALFGGMSIKAFPTRVVESYVISFKR